MTIDENTVFLITKDSLLTINPIDENGTSFHYEGELEENVLGILAPCICTKCDTPNILFGLDGSQVVEVHPREMGTESFFIYEVFAECDNCKSDLYAKFLFNEYANSVTFIEAEERDNCESHFISNLQFVAKQFASLFEKQFVSNEELDFFFDEEKLGCCRILVEGKDDKPILDAFLSKSGLIRDIDYHIFSGYDAGNGFKAVLTAVRILKKLKAELPFIAFVDSDNKRENHIELLKASGADDDEIFVLKKEEIEDYIVDVKALSIVTKKPEYDIQQFISKTNLNGKALLPKLFHSFKLPSPKTETKKDIANNMSKIPEEIKEFSKILKQKITEYPK